jgi:hypothetical protein
MSRTIEAIIEKLAPIKRVAMRVHAKRLTANWQNGLEAPATCSANCDWLSRMVAADQPA